MTKEIDLGNIFEAVRSIHFSQYPDEEEIIRPFLPGFTVTWAKHYFINSVGLSAYLLTPETFMKEAYGFTKQVLLAISMYEDTDTRTLHAIDTVFQSTDLEQKGVETFCCFLVSKNKNIESWLALNVTNHEHRIVVPFHVDECLKNKHDSFYIRNILNEKYFVRDIFDYRLPLKDDAYFYGRKQLANSILDSVKNGKNKGIFGLRKTGKTSLLFKIKRLIEHENSGTVFIYDCKTPSIRKLHWHELYMKIINDLCKRYELEVLIELTESNVSEVFEEVLSQIPDNQKIIVIFDEIEWISFKAKIDLHWNTEYLDFWQTFWSSQSNYRNLTTVIAGVNPSITEVDIVNGVQNPLFGIVSNEYIKGLEFDDIKEMLKAIGKRMGIVFESDTIDYLFSRYGGHPLLTRLACSSINNSIKAEKLKRPFAVKKNRLAKEEVARDSELAFYCKHVVSELQEFYPDEYNMLENIASGQLYDIIQFAKFPEFRKHLESYGLLKIEDDKIPRITIPAVDRYIGIELATREGRGLVYRIVPLEERVAYIKRRVGAIIADFNFFQKLLEQKGLDLLFGVNSFPEADKLVGIPPANTEKDFSDFINTFNRCFVESVTAYGNSLKVKGYFYENIKDSYSSLFQALNRIKVYRNNQKHLKLNSSNIAVLVDYLSRDLEGKSPSSFDDLYFILQQITIDSLLTSLQIEINSIS